MNNFDELVKLTTDVVLFDTNVVINLENRSSSNLEFIAVSKLFDTDLRPLITDLSFCELLIGCRELSDLKRHLNELDNMEFMTCGWYEPMCIFLSSFDYDQINEDSFIIFKQNCIKLRDEVVYPIYYKMLKLYIISCILLFHEIDKLYWDGVFILFNRIFENEEKEFVSIINDCYKEFINDKNQSKKLIKDIFECLIINLLISENPEKYNEKELEIKLERSLTSSNFSKLLKMWHIRKTDNINWNIKGYIENVRKIIGSKNDNPIVVDGICFLVARILFNGANYNSNDLIDLLNISFASRNDVKVHYFTNDYSHKWNDFIELEKEFYPNINIYFNR